MEALVAKLIEAVGPGLSVVLSLVLAAVVFAGLRHLVKLARGLAGKTENKIDDGLVDAIESSVIEAEKQVQSRLPKK